MAETVRQRVKALLDSRGLLATVGARAKEVDSLLGKALLKDRTAGLDLIRDKAGVRASVYFPDDVPTARALILESGSFDVRKVDDKLLTLGDQQFGYIGIHFDVVLPGDDLPADMPTVKGELWCEVQLHSAAQTLFANVSHPLLYKTPEHPPVEVRRVINSLSVMGEIYDRELKAAREAVMGQDGYPAARLMMTLERQLLALAGRQGDPEITQVVVDVLSPLYGDTAVDAIEAQLVEFAQNHREVINYVLQRSITGIAGGLGLQPASLMIFERLEHDPFSLRDTWEAAELPREMLEELAAVWGKPYPG